MILDNIEKIKSSYDICIIGAGASGLVISEKLSKKYKILITDFISNYNYNILYNDKYNSSNFYDDGRSFYILKKEV